MPYFNPAAPPFHPTAPSQSPWSTGAVYRSLPRRDRAEDRSSRSHNWRNRDRSPSPPPFLAADSSGPTDPNAPPAQRQRTHQRSAPLPSPSAHYLAASLVPSTPLPPPAENAAYEPPLLMLDLNHTLLCRAQRNWSGSKLPLVRPYLATFLEYICSDLSSAGRPVEEEKRRKPRFLPIVFSSARQPNVLSLLTALSLVPPSRLPLPPTARTYTPSRKEGDVLDLVWTREMMGLNARDFTGDVETTKDLEGFGASSGSGSGNEVGARRTILLDDEASKAAQQPHNHLPIAPFLVSPSDFPRPAIFQNGDIVPQALEFATSSPAAAAQDAALVSTIYVLERLTRESHVAGAIRAGFVERVKGDVGREIERERAGEVGEGEVEDEMQRRGRKVCEELGIEVRREWDAGWRDRVVGLVGEGIRGRRGREGEKEEDK
ncbi:hypothetical protein JCM5296_001701 [Sporobolomyces johnsonii]